MSSRREPINTRDREEIKSRLIKVYGERCWYCGIHQEKLDKLIKPCSAGFEPGTLQIDHINPEGANIDANLALACGMCNRAKTNLPPTVFLQWLEHVRCSAPQLSVARLISLGFN